MANRNRRVLPQGVPTPWEPLAYADGLTAAQYIEDGDPQREPQAIPQEVNWQED